MLGALQPKEKVCDAPLHLPSSVACCYGNSRQWNGLSLEKKHRAPTPLCSLPLASSPTFVSQRSFILQKLCWPRGLQATRLLSSLTGCCPLMEGSADPGNVWVITSNCSQQHIPFPCTSPKKPSPWVISSRLLYVPLLPWNPSSAPVVSLCESRWLQQSEKCLEFANPGLWASSCLAIFFLRLVFTAQCLQSGLGFRGVTWAQLHDEVPACWTRGCMR